MIDKLEHNIKKFNNKEIFCSAFLSIAIPIALMPVVGGLALITSSIAAPFLFNGLINRRVFKEGKTLNVLDSFTSKHYKKIFKDWFIEYVNQSNNPTEKKYKVFFTKMWLDSKTLHFKDYISSKDPFIKKLSDEIKQYDNVHHNIIHSFLYEKDEVSFSFFMNDEEDFSNKKDIIKSVYKDFEHLGLLAQNINFMTTSIFRVLAFIQDYQFSESDVVVLKQKVQSVKKQQSNKNKSSYQYSNGNKLYLYNTDIETINQFIEFGNLTTLKELKNVITYIPLGTTSIYCLENMEDIQLRLNKQIEYLNLENNLSKKDAIIKVVRKI